MATACGSGLSDGSGDSGAVTIASAAAPLNSVPYLAAISLDTFKDQNLSIDYTPIGNSTDTVGALLTNRAAFASVGATTALSAIEEGGDLEFLASLSTPSTLLVLSSSYIQETGLTVDSPMADRIDALKGATIVTTSPGSTNDAFLRLMLKEGGLDPDEDVKIIGVDDFASQSTGLSQGRYDAVAVGSGFGIESNILDKTAQVWLNSGDPSQFPDLQALFIAVVANRGWLDDHPDEAQAAFNAISAACQKVHNDPDMVKDSLKQRFFEYLPQDQFNLGYQLSASTFSPNCKVSQDQFDTLKTLQTELTGDNLDSLSYDDLVYEGAQE